MNTDEFIRSHPTLGHAELSELLRKEGVIMTPDAVRKRRARKALRQKLSPAELVTQDIQSRRERMERTVKDKKYKALIERVEELESLVDVVKQSQDISTYVIPHAEHKQGEATAVVVASDWHTEELVDPSTVNDLNSFNLDISDKRMDAFFQNTVRLIAAKQKSIKVKTLILCLLGDFISGSIHEELAETNLLPPADALIRVQNKLASGIEYILKHTDVSITLPCHSGNHGRMTKERRFASEKGNSLEYIMYHNLSNHFRGEKRVKFLIAAGYLSYLDVGDFTLRLHHGHSIKYGGGIGGIFVPTFKAISQWDKARQADMTIFGHYHQLRYGGNFISNGSLIGYNAYAVSCKCDYEPPKQAFFLINHARREVTDFSPVWLE